MTSITLTAPAKVNLFLKVLNKRKDSYHNLINVFERIALADTITISKIPIGIELRSDKLITRDPMDNIACKAAKLILTSNKVKAGVKIEIKKRIPIAAGLGGGSSDAASVLVGIDRLFGLKLSRKTFIALGAQLGADVPFFLLNTPLALGQSKGEKLRKLTLKEKLWHLVVFQGVKTSTKDIYEAFDASTMLGINPERSRRVDRLAAFRHRSGPGSGCLPKCLTINNLDDKMSFPSKKAVDYNMAESMLHNDLGSVVVGANKSISSIIQCLASSQDKHAIVSGSGPSVFCLYRTRREAIEGRRGLLGSIPASGRKGWRMFIVETQV